MKRCIVFRPVARQEFDAAADWYESRRAGLGGRFVAAVERVLERIAVQPDFYPDVFLGTREATVRGYPYCIYYREQSDSILVLAVFHTSRNPAVWRGRR